MKTSFYGESDKGIRLENQDKFVIFKNKYDFLIFAVADGMGGHKGGRFASLATIKLVEYMYQNVNFGRMFQDEIEKYLIDSVKKIQNYLIKEVNENNLPPDMGTTLNLNVIVKDNLYTLNIGDSRASQYLKRQKDIFQISEDHNLATLAEKDTFFSQFKGYSNYLTSALGPKKTSKVDIFITKLDRQGIILVTSDGAHNFVTTEEILKILKQKNDIKDKVISVVNQAKKNKSTDNITCVMVEYEF